MGYELNIPLKAGALELEFDTLDEMEKQLAGLDLPRIERAVSAALRGKPVTPKNQAPKKRMKAKKSKAPATKRTKKRATKKK